MKWSKEFQEEFKNNIKEVAKQYCYEIPNDELEMLYNSYFDKNVGILPLMIHSRVQDFMFVNQKEQENTKENGLEWSMNTIAKQKFEEIKDLKKQIPTSDNKQSLENQIITITEELKENALKLFQEPSNIKNFLDNIGKFNNYSYYNTLLIYLQKPDAKFVAPFKTYKDLGYSVKRIFLKIDKISKKW